MKKLLPIIIIFCLIAAYSTWMYGEASNFENQENVGNRVSHIEQYEPVELVEKRTQNSKTYFLGFTEDGRAKYAWDGTIGAIHYKDGPNDENELWKEIDTTLVGSEQLTVSSYGWGMEKAGYHAYFQEKFNAGKVVRFEKQGEWLEIEPGPLKWIETGSLQVEQLISEPQEVISEVNENKIYWENAYGQNLDFEWLTHNTRLEKHLIIKNFEDLPQLLRDPASLMLELNLGFESSEQITMNREQGIIEFKDESGETLWSFLPLRYWDSSKPRKEGISEFRLSMNSEQGTGNNETMLSIRVPYEWLQSAVYPVFIDVVVDEQVGTGADDGYIYPPSGFQDTEWNANVGGAESGGGRSFDSWYRFVNISGLSGATIDVAYISLWGYQSDTGTPLTKIFADDQASPTAPISFGDMDGRTRTAAGVDWDSPGLSPSAFTNSPSIVSVIQELADSYDPSAIQILHDDDGSSQTETNLSYTATYDRNTSEAPKLYIEYTLKALGESCSSGGECDSGNCQFNVCCKSTCTGDCHCWGGQVGASADDGYIWGLGFNPDKNSLWVGTESAYEHRAWYRFANISGLSGQTIDVAYYELYGDGNTGSPVTKIYADDQEAPTAPSNTDDYDGRTTTAAAVDWDGTLTLDAWNQSPSIISIIQELADSYDPSAIQLLHKDDGGGSDDAISADTFESNPTLAAKLYVEYTPPAEECTAEMCSDNYRMLSSSINVGGHQQTSASYKMRDTIGDIATDTSTSTSYKIKAGYQATWDYPPVLIFSITDNTSALGTITTSAASTDTTGFTVATNAVDGYAVTTSGNTLTSNSSSADIDALSTPSTSSPGTEQFGINLVDNSDPNVGTDPSGGSGQAATGYDTANNFKFVSGNTIANSSSFSDTTTFTISYLGNISNSTVAGDYSSTLTVIATGTF